MTPPRNRRIDDSEIDLPGGFKFRGAATKQLMPYLGWIVALGVGGYFMVGPYTQRMTNLETKASVMAGEIAELRHATQQNGDGIADLNKYMLRWSRLQSAVHDARGTEVSAWAGAVPTATANR